MGTIGSWSTLHGQTYDTLRVATYNLLNYPGSTAAARNKEFRKVVHGIKPDILVVQEMSSQAGATQFLDSVMNRYTTGGYATIPFHDGPDTDNQIYYHASKVAFLGATYISTALRDIAHYQVRAASSSEVLHIYSVHLKASTGSANEAARLAEATILRDSLNALPAGSHFIVVGDYNIQRSSESAFQKLVGNETNNNGRCFDPLNLVGTWYNDSTFALYHTQSPRVRSFGGGATGGMDDRFDIMLNSSSLQSRILTSTYTAYGNDGRHFNDSINRLPNFAVPDSVAIGLHNASDHLPVFASYRFIKTSSTVVMNAGWNLVSVPVSPSDFDAATLFPGAIPGTIFGFLSGIYTSESNLVVGEGYWAFYGNIAQNTISGAPVTTTSIHIATGNRWVLIGSITIAQPVANLTSQPAGAIVPGTLYEYNGTSYSTPTMIEPGKGYWVFVNAPCTITISQ